MDSFLQTLMMYTNIYTKENAFNVILKHSCLGFAFRGVDCEWIWEILYGDSSTMWNELLWAIEFIKWNYWPYGYLITKLIMLDGVILHF